jgi:putative FmdB family regulatory protein
MPTYEYACRACGHIFEIVQKMSDDPLVICPECGGELRKVFSAPAIAFKGPGFYATDHGKKKTPASAESKDTKKDVGEKKESKDSKKPDASSSSKSSTSDKGSSS